MNYLHERTLLNVILSNYSFYSGQIDSFRSITKNLYNDNFHVQIDGKSWVVKKCQSPIVKSRFMLSHEVQLSLMCDDFPLALLEQTKTKSSFVVIDGVFYTVHRWVAGCHLSPLKKNSLITNNVVKEIASSLARMHLIVNKGSFVAQDEFNTVSWSSLFNKAINQCHNIEKKSLLHFSLIRKLRYKRHKSEFENWIVDRFPFFVKIANELVKDSFVKSYVTSDVKIPVHNDINWENIIFDNNCQLTAFIDFDNLIYAPRLYEVGAATVVITGADKLKVETFIDAYDRAFGVVSPRSLVYVSMLIKSLSSILFSINSFLKMDVGNPKMLIGWCYYLDNSFMSLLTDHTFGLTCLTDS